MRNLERKGEVLSRETIEAIRQKLTTVVFVSEEMIRVESFQPSLVDWVVRCTFDEYIAMHPQAYSHPANWWQAIKQRFFPAFMLRIWPVKMTEIDVWAVVNKDGGLVPFFQKAKRYETTTEDR